MTAEIETAPSIRPEAIELPPTFSIDITYWATGSSLALPEVHSL